MKCWSCEKVSTATAEIAHQDSVGFSWPARRYPVWKCNSCGASTPAERNEDWCKAYFSQWPPQPKTQPAGPKVIVGSSEINLGEYIIERLYATHSVCDRPGNAKVSLRAREPHPKGPHHIDAPIPLSEYSTYVRYANAHGRLSLVMKDVQLSDKVVLEEVVESLENNPKSNKSTIRSILKRHGRLK